MAPKDGLLVLLLLRGSRPCQFTLPMLSWPLWLLTGLLAMPVVICADNML
jgi:hypothetical protein